MPRVVFEAANECIYCGSQTLPLTTEHIIAYSFGGNFELPNASCSECAKRTSLYEQKVARNTYHLSRSLYRMPSRRKKDFPSEAAVKLLFGKYGPEKQIKLPIEEAPVSHIVPRYKLFKETSDNRLYLCELGITPAIDGINQNLWSTILRKYNAYSAEFTTGGLEVGHFERVLWKISCGLSWINDKSSLLASNAQRYALGKSEPFVVEGESLYILDIFSVDRPRTNYKDARAAIFTRETEKHAYLHCEIDIFGCFDLPKYICTIRNSTGLAVDRREFRS